jgi:hypothetical protein
MSGQRPKSHEIENENLKPGGKPGEPPRPATEPKGSEGSASTEKTKSDPATGAPR